MKKISLFFVFIFGVSLIFAQNKANIVSQNESQTIISFKVDDFSFQKVKTPKGLEFVIDAPEGSYILQKGAPDLQKFTASISIPDLGGTDVEIISSDFKEYKNISIAPSKGNFTRDKDPDDIPFTYGKVYQQNQFFPGELYGTDKPYIMRDLRGQAIHAYPFQYNPVTKVLRVYSEIVLKVTYNDKKEVNEFQRNKPFSSVSYEFNQIYKNHFLNYDFIINRYDPVEEEGSMLIICYDDWTAQMQDFVDWKNTIGRPTEMVTVTDAGNTASAIKTYVENYYNDNDLAYLLLVGDAAQVPTNSGSGLGGDSDNAYAYIVGNDHYLDFFVGRFSAENPDDVVTQVERSIEYEQGDALANDWLNITMGVTSSQGPGDDDEYDYEHYRNMATDLLAFTYVSSLELFDGSQGGNDAPGDPTPTMVGNDINDGVGIINYTGHGSTTSWGSSGFSNSDIDALTNDNMLPFIWSVACVNGNFVNNTCFGEAWLRASNNGEPTGAVAIMASTINQSWSPPMAAQDEMVDILVESYPDNIKRTYAGLSINGCHLMNDEYSDFDMTDTWTCFGDPSLLVRTDNPQQMSVTHDDVIIYGNSSFTVNTGFEEAFAVLSKDGEIIGTASGSVAEIPLNDQINPGDEITLAVTGFNKITYITIVTVIAPSGPYIVNASCQIDDAQGNNNGQADYRETFNIDITLENVGSEGATNVVATVTTSDPYVESITNNENISFGNIAADETATSSDAFTVTMADSLPDQYKPTFDIEIQDDSKASYDYEFSFPVNAPIVSSTHQSINDVTQGLSFLTSPELEVDEFGEYHYDVAVYEIGGNGDGKLDPGERAEIIYKAENTGHADFYHARAVLKSFSDDLTVLSDTAIVGTIGSQDYKIARFTVVVNGSTQIGTVAELKFILFSDDYSGQVYKETLNINFNIGIISEDFETGDFSNFNWQFSGDADWTVQSNTVYEGSYSAQSGDITDDQTTTLEISGEVLSNGEISFYAKTSSESSYDFFTFYIDGTEKGSWSGDVDWQQFTYDVAAGNHTFTWEYEKDYTVSTNNDCAYLDNIVFPPISFSRDRDIIITANPLPTWLSIEDNGNGTADIFGTAPEAPSGNESYSVTVMAFKDTMTISQDYSITVKDVTAIDGKNAEIKVYPNPIENVLNIELPDKSDEAQAKIYDMSGKLLTTENLKSLNNQINIDFTGGFYLLEVEYKGKKYTKRIMIK